MTQWPFIWPVFYQNLFFYLTRKFWPFFLLKKTERYPFFFDPKKNFDKSKNGCPTHHPFWKRVTHHPLKTGHSPLFPKTGNSPHSLKYFQTSRSTNINCNQVIEMDASARRQQRKLDMFQTLRVSFQKRVVIKLSFFKIVISTHLFYFYTAI